MKKNFTFSPFKNWLCCGLLAALAFTSFGLQAQVAPAVQWDRTLGGIGADQLFDLQQTFDGGYILGGFSYSSISGDKSQNHFSVGLVDYWIIKTDANGNKEWDRTFGGIGGDLLFDLQQTSDGGFILGGNSDSGISGSKSQTSRGQTDYWIVRLDANGNKIWDKTFGGNWLEYFRGLQQTSDGGFIIGGASSSEVSGDKSEPRKGPVYSLDYWIIKLDSNGNKIWDKTIGGLADDFLCCLQQTSDKGYILGGYSRSGIGGDKSGPQIGFNDYWVVKVDSLGNKVWDKTYGGDKQDLLYALQQTSDRGYILGGTSESNISGNKSQNSRGHEDYWIIKTDSIGNVLWDKTIGGDYPDDVKSLQQTTDGGYIIGGASWSNLNGDKSQNGRGHSDYWLVKLNATGAKAWDITIGGDAIEDFGGLQQTSDGGFILGGDSQSSISGEKTQASKGSSDYWIVKLAPEVTGVKEAKANFDVAVYPNPNKGKFNLQLHNLNVPTVEATVTDLLGRVVWQRALPVTASQVFEEVALPAVKGMYLLQLKAGAEVVTRKVVVE